MKYQALRTIYGEYGHRSPGEVFDVSDDQSTLKRMKTLESRGLVARYKSPPYRAAFQAYVQPKAQTEYSNKALQPPVNKRG